jgi:hypothetical protein
MREHRLRIGGVMRCCLQTWQVSKVTGALDDAEPGDLLPCRYCDQTLMLAEDGIWEWNHPKPEPSQTEMLDWLRAIEAGQIDLT